MLCGGLLVASGPLRKLNTASLVEVATGGLQEDGETWPAWGLCGRRGTWRSAKNPNFMGFTCCQVFLMHVGRKGMKTNGVCKYRETKAGTAKAN